MLMFLRNTLLIQGYVYRAADPIFGPECSQALRPSPRCNICCLVQEIRLRPVLLDKETPCGRAC